MLLCKALVIIVAVLARSVIHFIFTVKNTQFPLSMKHTYQMKNVSYYFCQIYSGSHGPIYKREFKNNYINKPDYYLC